MKEPRKKGQQREKFMETTVTHTFQLSDDSQIIIYYGTTFDLYGHEVTNWNSVKAIRTKGNYNLGVLTDTPAAFLKYLIDNEGKNCYKDEFPIEMTHRERAYKKIEAFLGEYSSCLRYGRGIPVCFSRKPEHKLESMISEQSNAEVFFENELQKAEEGNIASMLQVGALYYHGVLVDTDYRKAAQWLKKVSEAKSEYSFIADKFIARMYYSGVMPKEEQSYEKSYEYHLRSSQEDIYSAGQVAFMKSVGSGCQYDYEKTERYYLSIINTLDNPRKDSLCTFYMNHGEYHKAAKIYETIADVYPTAGYQLGLMYKHGVLSNPFMPDYQMADKYFRMSLELGYTMSAFEIGTLYFNPTGNFKKDFVKAQKYFQIAVEHDHYSIAQYMLGYMYLHGHVSKDRKKAIQYFEMAADQGHTLSIAHLGKLYLQSDFLDYQKAFKCVAYSANCGDAPSKYILGVMYLFGKGCEPDEDKAYFLLKEASTSGAPEATVLLKQLETGNV